MKLSAALSILGAIGFAIQVALPQTLQALFYSPALFFRPAALSRLFMSHVWAVFGNGADEGSRPIKEALITRNASGIVLDIGAGYGHTAKYLDRTRVSKYVALEPNTLMHDQLRIRANDAGFTESDGTLLILSCGAEDSASIISSLSGQFQPVDTLVSVLTLCSIPSPERVLTSLVHDILKPGGQLLFHEHVLNPREDVAWWQRFWSPLWKLAFDGCRLDRPTHLWVERMCSTDDDIQRSIWGESHVWDMEGEPEDDLFWFVTGRYVKA